MKKIKCHNCNHENESPKSLGRGFRGFQKYICENCNKLILLPLSKTYRNTYLIVLAFLVFAFIGIYREDGGFPGIIWIILIVLLVTILIKDFKLNQNTSLEKDTEETHDK